MGIYYIFLKKKVREVSSSRNDYIRLTISVWPEVKFGELI